MGLLTLYKCPVCKNDPKIEEDTIHINKRREKKKGGKYLEFHTGICGACGVVYSYKVVESSIFEEEK